jgi:hypothetical protein
MFENSGITGNASSWLVSAVVFGGVNAIVLEVVCDSI